MMMVWFLSQASKMKTPPRPWKQTDPCTNLMRLACGGAGQADIGGSDHVKTLAQTLAMPTLNKISTVLVETVFGEEETPTTSLKIWMIPTCTPCMTRSVNVIALRQHLHNQLPMKLPLQSGLVPSPRRGPTSLRHAIGKPSKESPSVNLGSELSPSSIAETLSHLCF